MPCSQAQPAPSDLFWYSLTSKMPVEKVRGPVVQQNCGPRHLQGLGMAMRGRGRAQAPARLRELGGVAVLGLVLLHQHGAAAFQQHWRLTARAPCSAGALCLRPPSAGSPRALQRGLAVPRPRHPCRTAGAQNLRAQADVAATIVGGATSLSGAAVLCGVIAFHELGHFLAAKV